MLPDPQRGDLKLASFHKKNEAQPDFTDFTEDSREKGLTLKMLA